MAPDLRVTEVRYSPATRDDSTLGLLGFVSFLINNSIRIDGVTVRRSLAGRLILSWPARTDSAGTRHPLVRPISTEARLVLEEQVLSAIGLTGGAP